MDFMSSLGKALGSSIIGTVADTVDEYFYTDEERSNKQSKKTQQLIDMYNAESDREIAEKKINADDRDSARKLQMSMVENGQGIERIFIYLLALALIGGSFYFMDLVFTKEIENENVAMYALGTVNSLLMAIVYFFFGSSSGSKNKTDIINTISKKG